MKWCIVRHAEKETGDFYNPTLCIHDHPISAAGQAQAQALVSYFAGKAFSKIYVSQYIRTSQTAAPTGQALGLEPIQDKRLNEIDAGRVGMLSEAEFEQKFPEEWNAFRKRDRDFTFPGGESGTQVQERILSFFSEHIPQGEDLLLVSHDGWTRLVLSTLLGLPVYQRWQFRVDYCGITEIEYRPGLSNWQIVRVNHTVY